MELLDNTNLLFGDDLKQTLRPGARLKVAASCFSMYVFEEQIFRQLSPGTEVQCL